MISSAKTKFAKMGPFLMEKSKWIMISRAVGAAANIGLNFLLIPYMGFVGAAWATCFSFGIMAFVLFCVNRRLYPISYEWKKLIYIVVTVSAMAGLTYLTHNEMTIKIMECATRRKYINCLKICGIQ